MAEAKPNHPLYGRYPSQGMKALFPQPSDYRTRCSTEMQELCSDKMKFEGWRRIWVFLAEAEKELGLKITPEQLADFYLCEKDIDYKRMKEIERVKKHDVMSGAEEFSEMLNREGHNAGGWVHAGATSCSITDNQELMAMKLMYLTLQQKMNILQDDIAKRGRREFDGDNYTQRWLAGAAFVNDEMRYRLATFKARGAKGTTGTQESFMELFGRDQEKVKKLDDLLTKKMGFDDKFAITGQTYPRIFDYQMTATLGLIAKLGETMNDDINMGANVTHQPDQEGIGKACKDILSYVSAMASMASNQWLERTLDDSAQRRIVLNDAFCAADYLINKLIGLMQGAQKSDAPLQKTEEEPLLAGNQRKGLEMIAAKTADAINRMGEFALQYKDLACRGMTHYQTAQPTTIGKRIALWSYGFVLALDDVEHALDVSAQKGIDRRIVEYRIATALNAPAVAAAKTAVDIRLLQHDYEVSEPFAVGQVGSSAMPHKRNPMKDERIDSLANVGNNYLTRDLDEYNWLDVDSILELVLSVFVKDTEEQKGFTVNLEVVTANLMRELPFLCAEPILMQAVKKGGDRQKLHHEIQQCALAAWSHVLQGKENDMLELAAKAGFDIDLSRKQEMLDPMKYIGRAPEQTAEFCEQIITPIAKRYEGKTGKTSEVNV